MDLVLLFGFKIAYAIFHAKDLILLSIFAIVAVAYLLTSMKNKATQRKLSSLAAELDVLKRVEQDFVELQKKVSEDEEHRRQLNSSQGLNEDQFEHGDALRHQVEEVEKQLEASQVNFAPLSLQPLLRKTYEVEMIRINCQRKEELREMQEAKDMFDKLKKKQNGFLNQFRLAQLGADDLDRRILSLKTNMEATARSVKESLERWTEIERICGFDVVSCVAIISPSLASHYASSTSSNLDAPFSIATRGSILNPLSLALASAIVAVPNALNHPSGLGGSITALAQAGDYHYDNDNSRAHRFQHGLSGHTGLRRISSTGNTALQLQQLFGVAQQRAELRNAKPANNAATASARRRQFASLDHSAIIEAAIHDVLVSPSATQADNYAIGSRTSIRKLSGSQLASREELRSSSCTLHQSHSLLSLKNASYEDDATGCFFQSINKPPGLSQVCKRRERPPKLSRANPRVSQLALSLDSSSSSFAISDKSNSTDLGFGSRDSPSSFEEPELGEMKCCACCANAVYELDDDSGLNGLARRPPLRRTFRRSETTDEC